MKFPGRNRLELSHDALQELVMSHLQSMIGDVRITELRFDSYPTRLMVEFTDDPKPIKVPIEETAKMESTVTEEPL
jgi:hypothetical protein